MMIRMLIISYYVEMTSISKHEGLRSRNSGFFYTNDQNVRFVTN